MPRNPLPIRVGTKSFDFSCPLIMGILNITPDSFSDGGKFLKAEHALEHAHRMQTQGADIIDIGGESTRPGSDPVSVEEELERVIPVIVKLSKELEIPLSIDTCKSEVAEEALKNGAAMINDISGLQGDDRMALVAAEYDVPLVAMHMRGTPKNMQQNPVYSDIIGEICDYFEKSLEIAQAAGMKRERIILDPGIGFGKTFDHNFEVIRNLREFKKFGLPLMVGASRKRFLSIDNQFSENERLEQSLALACAAVLNGADIIRVHDVLETRKALWTIAKINIAGLDGKSF